MPTSRRTVVFFLGIGGATVASLTAAGFLYRAVDRGSFSDLQGGGPFEPWREWQEGRLLDSEGVALAGTLAASSLNTQPWLFRLERHVVDLYLNRRSYALFIDPYDRDVLLGLGCCIENMMTAAEGLGTPASLRYFPNPDNSDHVARLTLGTGAPNETPRFLAIANRHTNRSRYHRDRMPSASILATLKRLSPSGSASFRLFAAESPAGQSFIEGTLAATEEFTSDPSMMTESFRWFRQTMDQVKAARDGTSFLSSGLTDLQVRTGIALPDINMNSYSQMWLETTRNDQMPYTPMFGLLCVDDLSNPTHLLEAGRLLQRLHLEVTARNLALQPLSQMNRIADREEARGGLPVFRERLASLSGGQGYVVLGLRLGYPKRPARISPRRPFPTVLVPRLGPLRPTHVHGAPPPSGPSKAPNPRMNGPVSNPPKK